MDILLSIGGDLYETCEQPAELSDKEKDQRREKHRERLRLHKLAVNGMPTGREINRHDNELSEGDKGKNFKPFNRILKLIKLYDGLRIYKLN